MIDIYSASSNLGDNLSMIPLMRAGACRLHLIDDPGVRSIAPLFDGLGEVVFDNVKRLASPESQKPGPHSAKLLEAHGARPTPSIPYLDLTEDEIAWAREYLSGFDISKTCVLKASTAQIGYRTPPAGTLDKIIEANPDITFFTSALSNNHVKHNFHHVTTPRTYVMWDLPVRKMAAIYSIIGRYIGPDCGDYHLMLAVYGWADVLVPPSEWHYDHAHFHYRAKDFPADVSFVRYHPWTKSFTSFITNLNVPSS